MKGSSRYFFVLDGRDGADFRRFCEANELTISAAVRALVKIFLRTLSKARDLEYEDGIDVEIESMFAELSNTDATEGLRVQKRKPHL